MRQVAMGADADPKSSRQSADPGLKSSRQSAADLYDVAIIGGGAAGMMAAVSAAMTEHPQRVMPRVVVLEAQERVGRKLLATGNGRCNLSHEAWTPEHYHGRDARFALGALKRLDVAQTLDIFRQMGLLCRADEDGRIFPYSLQASAVLDLFRLRLERLGVLTLTSFKVDKLVAPAQVASVHAAPVHAAPAHAALTHAAPVHAAFAARHFRLQAMDGRAIQARSVIVATGGLAAPAFGCDGSGYRLMVRLGHQLVEPFPAIVQICTPQTFVRPLAGIKCDGIASVVVNGHVLRTEKGEILFTEYGLSGPPILQLSRVVNAHLRSDRIVPEVLIQVDYLPEMSVTDISDWLAERKMIDPDCPLPEFLTGLIHKKLGQALLKLAIGRPLNGPCSTLTAAECSTLVRLLKAWTVPAIDTRDWSQAQVTAGGLDVTQFQPGTMESRLIPGLYAAGEILDIDGDCGGYNLQWAWSSGWLAGRKAAEYAAAAGHASAAGRTAAAVAKAPEKTGLSDRAERSDRANRT